MQERSHQELTRVAARIAGWPDELIEDLASEAATPDRIHGLEIDGLGFRPLGYEAFSLCHFGTRVQRPSVKDKDGVFHHGGFVMNGYNWKRDHTGGKLDLPNRRVIAHPENWRWPMTAEMRMHEPLYVLTHSKGICLAADEFTFPAASSYANFFEWCIGKIPATWGEAAIEALCHFVAWAGHLVQDLCNPFHAGGFLLGGHAAFEGDQHECLMGLLIQIGKDDSKWRVSGPPTKDSFRSIAEGCAATAFVAAGVLTDDMAHSGERAKRVEASVLLSVASTILLLKCARERYLENPARAEQVSP